MTEPESIKLTIQWNGKPYEVVLETAAATVADVKLQLQTLTNVLVARQKIMGFMVKGKPAPDTVRLSNGTDTHAFPRLQLFNFYF